MPTDPEPQIRSRVEIFNGTVQELIDWCLHRGLDVEKVSMPSCHLRFESAESPEEIERRIEFKARQDQRHEEWERNTWLRLNEKFRVSADTGVTDK